MDVLLIVSQYIKIITISPYYIAVSYFWNMLERKLTYTCFIGLEEGDTNLCCLFNRLIGWLFFPLFNKGSFPI